MTEEMKKKLLAEINRLDEGVMIEQFTKVRSTLYFSLKSTINDIIEYDNSTEDNEEKIDRLFKQKEMIEQSIQTVSVFITQLADKIIENQIKGGTNG
jgi:hypothetical protein